MRIGRYTVNIIETCRFALDGGAMFGVVPKNLWSKAYPHVDEQNRIAMAARALLVRGGGKVILVDSGCGEKMGAKLDAIYGIDRSEFTLAGELTRHGVKPEEVTDFVYTHLHFDHAGGSTLLDESGVAVPMFPNARHYVQSEQLAWGRNPTDKDRASFMPDNWEPVVQRELLIELDGPGELFPDISLRLVNGHTKAMQLIEIKGDADENSSIEGLIYTADLMPTSAHLPYPYIMGYDNFPLTTLEEKKAIIPELYERNMLLCFEHDAFTQAARIAIGKRGFEIAERYEV